MLRLSSILRQAARHVSSSVRTDLAALHHVLFNHGMSEGVCNHLSVMAEENGEEVMLVSPVGRLWNTVTASSIVSISEKELQTKDIKTTEVAALTIHWSIHAARPDARVVAHVHAPYSTALSALEDPRLLMCHQNCFRFYDKIAYVNFNGFSEDMDEGKRLAEHMGSDAFILVMQNHGVTVVGDNVAETFDRLYYFERSCLTYLTALATGQPVNDVGKLCGKERCLQLQDACRVFEIESAPLHWSAQVQRLRKSGSNFDS